MAFSSALGRSCRNWRLAIQSHVLILKRNLPARTMKLELQIVEKPVGTMCGTQRIQLVRGV